MESWDAFRTTDWWGLPRHGGHHVDTRLKTRKAALRQPYHNALISLGKIGAGEGIRTLDPNLGKVVPVSGGLWRGSSASGSHAGAAQRRSQSITQ